ncbi:MAG: flagellar hook-length control protein FliK, partial [Clostridium sp.]|nr:flagellar hook-length control protein FliK [Clostridium sp.]
MKTQKVNIKGSLELKQGEILNGRVIKQDAESNKVILKLINGMEIQAEVEADVDLKGILLKFELAEVKDNVLFLKVLDNNTKDVSENVFKENTDEIMNFILKEGLKKEDYNMLKAMIKYNIPLTRENITKVKSMLEFSDKMNNNPKEIKNFINSYLNSRDIVVNSREGLQTAQKLYEFFEAFSKIDVNEVLLFLENNIEFSKENLDSFNKLF